MITVNHPGAILDIEWLKPNGISGNALRLAINVPNSRINDIILGRRGITADTALRLARFFSTKPDYWLDLQAAYDLAVAEREAGKAIRSIKPRPLEVAA